MIEHLTNPPNLVTSASLCCSVSALAQVIGPAVEPRTLVTASVLVILAGLLDVADGLVARRFGRSSAVGAQLDSFADLVGFGIAPAALLWVWKLEQLGAVGASVAMSYVIAAAFRLARFNVEGSGPDWSLPGHVRGLTTTMSGGVLTAIIWLANGPLPQLDAMPAAWAAAMMVLFAVLMMSSLPFRSFKDIRSSSVARTLFIAFAIPGLSLGLVNPAYLFGFCGAMYVVLGLVDALIVRARHLDVSADSPLPQ